MFGFMFMNILAIIACAACAVAASTDGGMFCMGFCMGFCMSMNGFIPDIGGMSVGESGCDCIVSGSIGAELLLTVGGGVRAAIETSST